MAEPKQKIETRQVSKSPAALVTGSTSGIGFAIALELAKNGFNIAVNGTREERKVEPILGEIRSTGAKAFYIRADVSSFEYRIHIVEQLRNRFGRIDVLVNNAGISPKERKDILEIDEENFDKVIKVNLKGPFFLTQLISKWMIELKQKLAQYEPIIVNISSISAYTSSTSRGEYCISKAGLSMMTKLYADRLSEHGINVYEIRPGIISTPMTQAVKSKYDKLIAEGITPIKRWGTPQDVAKAVAAITKGYFKFSTGEIFNVDGGFHIRRL